MYVFHDNHIQNIIINMSIIITHAIMSIRLERLIENLNRDDIVSIMQSSRLCKVYAEDLKDAHFDEKDIISMSDEFFQMELYILIGVKHLAIPIALMMYKKICKILTRYTVVMNRLLDTEQTSESVGVLYNLPMDINNLIADKLYAEYCF